MATLVKLCRALTRLQVSATPTPTPLISGPLPRLFSTRTPRTSGPFSTRTPRTSSLTDRLQQAVTPLHRSLSTTSPCPISTTPRAGATLLQMWRKGPHKTRKRKHVTFGKPQIKGVVLKTLIKKPKKPNSANRKCVRVRLSNGREVTAYVPGEGHSLQEHNIVLLRGGRVQDLPGVKMKVIRGKYDLAHVKK